MNTHTPGPWHACHDGECSCKIVSCAYYPIARITVGKWGDDYPALRLVGTSSLDTKAEAYMEQITYGEIGDDTATANARLIAAAPDLLKALKECTEQLWLLAKDPKSNPWVQQGQAAIAKASAPLTEVK